MKERDTIPIITISDADLNELTHAVADLIEKMVAVALDRYRLNDDLTALLAEHGVQPTED